MFSFAINKSPKSFQCHWKLLGINFHRVGTIRMNWLSNRFHIKTIRLRFLYTTGITAGFMTTSRYNSTRLWKTQWWSNRGVICIDPAPVQAACNTQFKRFSNISPTDIVCNADMHTGKIRQFSKLPEAGQSLMRAVISQLNLSTRA